MNQAPRIVIAKNGPIRYSETFITAHRDRLRSVVATLDLDFDRYAWDGGVQPRDALPYRLADAASIVARGYPWQGKVSHEVARGLRRRRADVVLAEYGTTGAMVRNACRRAGVPLVVHFHGFDASKTEVIERFGEEYRATFSEAAAVVAVSRVMRERLISIGCPRERIGLNACGFDREGMRPADASGSCGSTFLAVGRFVEKKAPHLTLFAFARCRRELPSARLIFFGDGPLWGMCRRLASELGVADGVEFRGAQPHERVLAEMRTADAFVQHSVVAESGDSEGTPVAVLEASAAGLPVIATRHAGIPDVVEDGVTGWLVDEQDVAAMAAAMREVACDPAGARRRGDAGRDFVGERFRSDASLGRLNRLLAGVAAGKAVESVATLNDEIEPLLVPRTRPASTDTPAPSESILASQESGRV